MPSPTKAGVFWIDHAIEFGTEHLRKNFPVSESIIFKLSVMDYSVLILIFLLLVFITLICIKLTIFAVDMIVNNEPVEVMATGKEILRKKEKLMKEEKRKPNGTPSKTTVVKKTKKKKILLTAD